MEFEFENSDGITVVGDVEITLPDHMTLLSQTELIEVQKSGNECLIIAAGRDPDTAELVFMTSTTKLLKLNVTELDFPDGDVYPSDFGQSVCIGPNFEIAADWIVENAISLF
jgi:hypothetical protein